MVPRFIIRNTSPELVQQLVDLGYSIGQHPLGEKILVLGTNLLNAPEIEKSPLLKILDGSRKEDIAAALQIAEIQKKWTASTVKTELTLGDPQKGNVTVTPLGVMIDSCIVSIETFRKVKADLNKIKSPFIASHAPVIKADRPFMTIGCAEYNLNDLDTILTAYERLLSPAT